MNTNIQYSTRMLFFFLMTSLLQVFTLSAAHSESIPLTVQSLSAQKKESTGSASQESTNTIMAVKAAIAENALNTTKDLKHLEIDMSRQQEKINNLEKQISELQKPADINTATLVLACVSIGITVLGVVIAILSIFGYANIKGEATKNAQVVARETVEKITKAELPAETEKNIIKLIEGKRFDSIIQNAVENVVYRGISIPDETLDDGGRT